MGKKISLETANEFAATLGYTVRSIETNRNSKLTVTCPKHGDFAVSWSNFRFRKSGCPKCKSERSASSQKVAFENFIEKASENGFYVHITKEEYEKSYSKKMRIEVTCACGHRHHKTSFHIRNSTGCIKCRWKNFHPTRITIEKLKEKTSKIGYEIKNTSLFRDSKSKITVTCPKHGDFETTYNTLDQGHRCYRCSSHGSSAEKQIQEFIKNLGIDFQPNDRSVLSGRELDIYIPSLNLAIEYCGLHWHTEEKKTKNYHYQKYKECKEKGIKLITIFEDEWLEREKQIKNILLSKLGTLPKLYARKTRIRFLDRDEASVFLENNHLQGSCNFLLAIGLEFEGQLVGCATLSRHHRNGKKDAVLSRICFGQYAVVGGSGKLLKAIMGQAKSLGFESLISWSDNRWSDGKVYKTLNMKMAEMSPDYSYVKNGSQKRSSKQSCQKKNLLKRGAVGKTELEMAKSLGYSRIWDCGKIRWSLAL